MKIRNAIVLAATLTFTVAAHADWTYTKWGMTVAQVKAASSGKAVDRPAYENDNCLLTQTYSAGDLELKADFCFTKADNKLQGVAVQPIDNVSHSCYRLQGELERKYGAPTATEHNSIGDTEDWNDGSTNIHLDMSSIGELHCYLHYRTTHTVESQGL